MKKRRIKKLDLFLVVLGIILVIIFSSILINLSNKESDLTIESLKVVKLYDKINDVYHCQNNLSFDPFKKNEEKIKVKEIDQDLIPLLIFRQLELDGKFDYSKEIVIKVDEFEEASKKILGFVPKYDFKEYEYQNIQFKFEDNKLVGKLKSVQCDKKYPIKKSKLVAFEEGFKSITLIVDIVEIDKNNNEEKINTYKYVFKEKKDNFYLKRIEKVIE